MKDHCISSIKLRSYLRGFINWKNDCVTKHILRAKVKSRKKPTCNQVVVLTGGRVARLYCNYENLVPGNQIVISCYSVEDEERQWIIYLGDIVHILELRETEDFINESFICTQLKSDGCEKKNSLRKKSFHSRPHSPFRLSLLREAKMAIFSRSFLSRGYFFLAVFFRITHDGLSERGTTRSLTNWQCDQLSDGLIAQLVEHCMTSYRLFC